MYVSTIPLNINKPHTATAVILDDIISLINLISIFFILY